LEVGAAQGRKNSFFLFGKKQSVKRRRKGSNCCCAGAGTGAVRGVGDVRDEEVDIHDVDRSI
jgi:hypothetical protein